MPTPEEAKAIKINFSDAVETSASAHKLIAAAKALRGLYRSLPEADKNELIEWVRLRSNLDAFISGQDLNYYLQIAVPTKGLRRANLEHLERYSSEETTMIATKYADGDEYMFNIWKSEWRYVENFLKQFDISYRIVSGSIEGTLSPQAPAGHLF